MNNCLQLTIAFNDPDLDEEEKNEAVKKLLDQMKRIDEIEEVSRVRDPNPPERSMALEGFLEGMITAKFNLANIKKVLEFLKVHVGKKPIEMNLKTSDGRELSIVRNYLMEMGKNS